MGSVYTYFCQAFTILRAMIFVHLLFRTLCCLWHQRPTICHWKWSQNVAHGNNTMLTLNLVVPYSTDNHDNKFFEVQATLVWQCFETIWSVLEDHITNKSNGLSSDQFQARFEKSVFPLCWTNSFSCWASIFSFSLAWCAKDQASFLINESLKEQIKTYLGQAKLESYLPQGEAGIQFFLPSAGFRQETQ